MFFHKIIIGFLTTIKENYYLKHYFITTKMIYDEVGYNIYIFFTPHSDSLVLI